MDITNRIVKICRRITDIEHALACNDQSEIKIEELKDELDYLNEEYEELSSIIDRTIRLPLATQL